MEISHDILLEVLKFLPTCDFLNFSLVCSSWSKAVKDDFIWIYKLQNEEKVLNLKEALKEYNVSKYQDLYEQMTGLIWDPLNHYGCIPNKSKITRKDHNTSHYPTAFAKVSWKTGKHSWNIRVTKKTTTNFDWYVFGVGDRGIVKLEPPYNDNQSAFYNQNGQYSISMHKQKFYCRHLSFSVDMEDMWKERSIMYPFTFRCELDIDNLEFRMLCEELSIKVYWKIITPTVGYTPFVLFSSSSIQFELLPTIDKQHHLHPNKLNLK